MRWTRVVAPALLGPMTALIDARGPVTDPPPTAMKPPKFLESPRTSSIGGPPRAAAPERDHRAGQPPGKDDEQDDPDGAQEHPPGLGAGDDGLVEPHEGQRAPRPARESAHSAPERR